MIDTKAAPQERDNAVILSRQKDGRYFLTDLSTDHKKEVELDKQTASKLLLLSSLGEVEKTKRLVSQKIGSPLADLRIDTALQNEMDHEQKQDKHLQDTGKNSFLNAHLTGMGAGGDFYLTARVQNEHSGQIREFKGLITGLNAALLRGDTNGQGEGETIHRNAQALAGENFEKAWSVAFLSSPVASMKMS